MYIKLKYGYVIKRGELHGFIVGKEIKSKNKEGETIISISKPQHPTTFSQALRYYLNSEEYMKDKKGSKTEIKTIEEYIERVELANKEQKILLKKYDI